jgi:hypothetical protein
MLADADQRNPWLHRQWDTFDHMVRNLGLPSGIGACLFDPAGVIKLTAALYVAAWKDMFDGSLGKSIGSRLSSLQSNRIDYNKVRRRLF